MQEELEEIREYKIPINYSGSGKIGGMLRQRNAVEAIMVFVVLYNLLNVIPFTNTMKVILYIVVCAPLVIWFMVGMNDESITQYIYSWFLYKRNRKNYGIILRNKKEIKEYTKKAKYQKMKGSEEK